MSIECEMEVFSHCGPFDDELITNDYEAAVARIRNMDPVQAVQLILATYCRSDSVIERRDLDDFAEFLGVFGEDDDNDDPEGD